MDAADPELRGVCYNSLCSLGFDLQQLNELPIGVFVSPAAMKEGLLRAGFRQEEIAASGLAGDARVAKRLIGPIRNVEGRIVNFWARHPEGERPKYLFFRRGWREEVPAFGLDVALAGSTGETSELLLVEDLLDALLLLSAGLPQAAATLNFARNLVGTRWEELAGLGVERVTLVPSDEREGLARATSARETSLRGGPAPEVFVLLPESFGHVKGLAKMIRTMDHELFWSWLKENRVPRTEDFQAASLLAGAGELTTDGRGSEEMREPEEPIEVPACEPERRRSSEHCPLHHCDPMFCFCWD